ncbi:hypothetical protein B0I22_1455 [Epilithonimonas xixisoli]|uniref:Uncharacterized protein n=1 Tax=Epilithonimonas xixisoli TaxID=1476462 RepID=A0A4R8IB48_9FLAO|nr:hypothetical protein B0I22_1455 [Epilithonimonas xixisoli]
MKKKIFSSKTLYLLNVIFNLILFIITVLSLSYFIFSNDDRFFDRNHLSELLLYCGYFIIYFFALIVLLFKPKKSILFLNIIYVLGILLNFYDFNIHYLKYEGSNGQIFFIILISIFTLIFTSLIYFNTKNKFKISFYELNEIGKPQD